MTLFGLLALISACPNGELTLINKTAFLIMTCCGHCRDAGDFFNEKTAKKDLKKYLRRGPDKSTRLLIEAVTDAKTEGTTLLDIGGGIGAIQLELFKHGLEKSINVDASVAYQSVSEQEVSKRGLRDKTEYHFGDYTDIARSLPSADIVTLDKVICCYPDMRKLLDLSLQKTGKICGLVFPRVNWFSKIGFRLTNLWFRLRKSEFRTYLHPPLLVEEIIRNRGFQRKSYQKTILWQVMTYEKT